MLTELLSLFAVVLFNDLRVPREGSMDVDSVPTFRKSMLFPCYWMK
jgi:hypothetical protein